MDGRGPRLLFFDPAKVREAANRLNHMNMSGVAQLRAQKASGQTESCTARKTMLQKWRHLGRKASVESKSSVSTRGRAGINTGRFAARPLSCIRLTFANNSTAPNMKNTDIGRHDFAFSCEEGFLYVDKTER